MDEWIYKYDNNEIIVRNDTSIELIVNGELQDVKKGIRISADLSGKLSSGELIKVSLGGVFKIDCSLFIDNVLQKPINIP